MARFKLYIIKADGGKKLKYESDNLDEVKNVIQPQTNS